MTGDDLHPIVHGRQGIADALRELEGVDKDDPDAKAHGQRALEHLLVNIEHEPVTYSVLAAREEIQRAIAREDRTSYSNAVEHLKHTAIALLDSDAEDPAADDDLRTDGGINRRDTLRSVGTLAAASAAGLPSLEQSDGEQSQADNEGLGLTEEQLQELRRDEELATKTHAYVDLPEEMWYRAVERASRAGAVGEVEDYLMDYFTLEFAFLVNGEEPHRSTGFDPESVAVAAAPDGEVFADVYAHPDEGTGDGGGTTEGQ